MPPLVSGGAGGLPTMFEGEPWCFGTSAASSAVHATTATAPIEAATSAWSERERRAIAGMERIPHFA
jgi:hypothetical protein